MGRSPCCVKEGLKKGPWTQEEDEKLIAYVKEHGHGNWRALPKKCGLLRCGKSCRLRWNNYLRPDIKRGMFTHSEEQKIFQLHALVGNKWAFIASQLPKRTDNEIKNYWNTVLKKRLQKERQNSLISFGVSRISPAAETSRQRQDTKIMQRQDNQNNIKSSGDAASKKLSCSSSTTASTVMSCVHLAQWESARLEAEARLAKESQSSKKTHTLFPFAYNMGHSFSSSNTTATTATTAAAFSSLSNKKQTNHQPLAQLSTCLVPNTLPSSISSPSCLIHHLHSSTINSLSSSSSLSLPAAIVAMASKCSASNSSSASASSKSLSSLFSQESIASALTLGPNGRLSWQAKELSFTASPSKTSHSTSQSSLISQMLCQIESNHNDEEVNELQASTEDGKLKAEFTGEPEQLNLEIASSIIVDLNSTMESSMDLNSTLENWEDFIFDVENSCSDVVSTTNWRGAAIVSSPEREQFTHDDPSLISNTTTAGVLAQCSQDQSSLDLEGLNFDSLLACEQFANQHSNVLIKELLWDTPTSLSISST